MRISELLALIPHIFAPLVKVESFWLRVSSHQGWRCLCFSRVSCGKFIFHEMLSRLIHNSETSDWVGLVGGHGLDRAPRGAQSHHQTVTKTKRSVTKRWWACCQGRQAIQPWLKSSSSSHWQAYRRLGAAEVGTLQSGSSNIITCSLKVWN